MSDACQLAVEVVVLLVFNVLLEIVEGDCIVSIK
jgi:hypothetical protein